MMALLLVQFQMDCLQPFANDLVLAAKVDFEYGSAIVTRFRDICYENAQSLA